MDIVLTGETWTAVLRLLLVLVFPMVVGLGVTLRLRGPYFAGERILLGATLGIVSTTMVTFVASLVVGLDTSVVWTVYVISAGLVLLTFWLRKRSQAFSFLKRLPPAVSFSRRVSKTDLYGIVILIASVLFFSIFSQRLITWQDKALETGIVDNWGDLPFHLGIVTSFLGGGEMPPANPTFADHPLAYPFLSDYFSAMLVLTGIPLEQSLEFPTVLMNSISMTLLFYMGYRIVRNRPAAALAPLLFVLAGGLGFLWFLSDVYYSNTPVWEILTHLPKRYTSLGEQNIRWINPTLAHLLPQRSFLFGFPIALSLAIFWWTESKRKDGNAWLPGVLAGLLPLSHAHTFLAMMAVSAMMAIISLMRKSERAAAVRYWTIFYGVTLLVAAPQLVYLLGSKLSAAGIVRFEPGWMAGDENLLWFWLKNTSMFLPLLFVAFILPRRLGLRRRALLFFVPFGMLLLICNFFLFSPLAYDTNKIFVFAFVLGMPFVATVLVAMFRSKSWWINGVLFRILFVSLIFSGTLNLIHELQSGGWQEFSGEEVDLAGHVRKNTESDAVFLTAPVHNNLLMLAGRQVVLGYPGHIFSHGMDHGPAEQAVNEIYSGGENAIKQLQQYRVSYIVVGPHEKSRFGASLEWLQGRFPEFARTPNYVIYTIDDDRL